MMGVVTTLIFKFGTSNIFRWIARHRILRHDNYCVHRCAARTFHVLLYGNHRKSKNMTSKNYVYEEGSAAERTFVLSNNIPSHSSVRGLYVCTVQKLTFCLGACSKKLDLCSKKIQTVLFLTPLVHSLERHLTDLTCKYVCENVHSYLVCTRLKNM